MHGIYTRADNPNLGHHWLTIRAAVAATAGRAVVTGPTALRVWGVQLPHRLDQDSRVHLLVQRRQLKNYRPEVVLHQYRYIDLVETQLVQGLQVAKPVEAWLGCALMACHEEMVQIGEGLMRYKNPITDPASIERFVRKRGGGLPVGRALAALVDMRPGTDSIRETQMRRWIVTSGLPEPQVNPSLLDDRGDLLARPDCYFASYRTLAEYDGDVHGSEANRVRDANRRRRLQNHGYELVTATKADLPNPMRFLKDLEAALGRQSAQLGLAAPVITGRPQG